MQVPLMKYIKTSWNIFLFLQFPAGHLERFVHNVLSAKYLKLPYWAPDLGRFQPESSLPVNQNPSLSGGKWGSYTPYTPVKQSAGVMEKSETTYRVIRELTFYTSATNAVFSLNNLKPGKAIYWSILLIYTSIIISIISVLIKSSHTTQRWPRETRWSNMSVPHLIRFLLPTLVPCDIEWACCAWVQTRG